MSHAYRGRHRAGPSGSVRTARRAISAVAAVSAFTLVGASAAYAAGSLQADLLTGLGNNGVQTSVDLGTLAAGTPQTHAVDLSTNGASSDCSVSGVDASASDIAGSMAAVTVPSSGSHVSGTIAWSTPAAETNDHTYNLIMQFTAASCSVNTNGADVTITFTIAGTGGADETDPTVTVSHAGANSAGWNNVDPVTVDVGATDNVGVTSLGCTDAVDGGLPAPIALNEAFDTAFTSYTLTVTGDGVHELSCTASDAAGNSGNDTDTVKLDATPPDVSLSGALLDNTSYPWGSVPVAPTCTASDLTSGLADADSSTLAQDDCAITGYGTDVGSHHVVATAIDNAGNTNTDTFDYTVVPWQFAGFYQPVDNDHVNTLKGGSTVPIKFEIFAGSTEITTTTGFTLTQKQYTCGSTAELGVDEVEATATGSTSLRYDTVGGQYIYNWQSPKTSKACYAVTIHAPAGSGAGDKTAYFQTK